MNLYLTKLANISGGQISPAKISPEYFELCQFPFQQI